MPLMPTSKRQYTRRGHRKWRKPQDKPKHPLTAYNIFFQFERVRMMERSFGSDAVVSDTISAQQVSDIPIHKPKPSPVRRTRQVDTTKPSSTVQELGFAGLARTIAARWKALDGATKALFEEKAQLDKARYQQELAAWKLKQPVETESLVSGGNDGPAGAPTSSAPKEARLAISLDVPNCVTPEKKVKMLTKDLWEDWPHNKDTCVMDTAVPQFDKDVEEELPLLEMSTMDSAMPAQSNNLRPSTLLSCSWQSLLAPSLSSNRQVGHFDPSYPMSLRLATSLTLQKQHQERMVHERMLSLDNIRADVWMTRPSTLTMRTLFPMDHATGNDHIPVGSSVGGFIQDEVEHQFRPTVSSFDSNRTFTSARVTSIDDENELRLLDPHFDFSSPFVWDDTHE